MTIEAEIKFELRPCEISRAQSAIAEIMGCGPQYRDHKRENIYFDSSTNLFAREGALLRVDPARHMACFKEILNLDDILLMRRKITFKIDQDQPDFMSCEDVERFWRSYANADDPQSITQRVLIRTLQQHCRVSRGRCDEDIIDITVDRVSAHLIPDMTSAVKWCEIEIEPAAVNPVSRLHALEIGRRLAREFGPCCFVSKYTKAMKMLGVLDS